MKKFYSLMLTAITMLLASFTANAAVTVVLSWDEADAVDIYVGGTGAGNKVTVPAGATSYTAFIDNTWGSTYVAPRAGYKLVNATCLEHASTIEPMSNGNIRVDMKDHDGHRVHVTVKKIEYDGTIRVNVINGREKITGYFWGTNREVKFHTGEQTIPYSTEFETGIDIQAPTAGAVEPYIKQNDVEMEWKAYYGWDTVLYHKYNGTSTKGFGFDQGTRFEIKYCETDDEPEVVAETATVTLNLQGQAATAIQMIRNVTKSQSIAASDNFVVEKDDVIRFTCNTKDYELTFNGTPLTPSTTADYTTIEFTVTANMTITVSAAEREYGTTTLTFYANDIEGLIFKDGGWNIIDPSKITPGSGSTSHSFIVSQTEKETQTVDLYTIEVSQKWGKAYIEAKEGYWLKYSEAADENGDFVGTTMISASPLYAWSRPIVADSKLSVWMRYNEETVEKPTLRDRNGQEYVLKVGYNEFMVDGEYVSPLKAQASWNEANINPEKDPSMEVYVNGSAVSADDYGIYNATIKGNSAIHVIAGQTAPPVDVTSNVTPEAWAAGASITVDYITELSATKTTVTSITGCDAVVKPAGEKFYINGQEVDEDYSNRNVTKNDNGTYTIKLSSATNSFAIGDFAKMLVSPSNGETVTEWKGITVQFPKATNVTVNEDLISDTNMVSLDQSASATAESVSATEDSDGIPTFLINITPTVSNTYKVMIPEGLFTVDGVESPEMMYYITYNRPIDMNNVAVMVTPAEGNVLPADFNPAVIFVDAEDRDPDSFGWNINVINDMTDITLSYNGTTLTYYEDWNIDIEKNYFMIGLTGEAKEGIYTLDIAADAINVGGTPYPKAIKARWTVKSHPMHIAANLDDNYTEVLSVADLESLEKIYIRFPEAKTVTINDEAGAILSSTDAGYDEFGEISEVEGTEKPTFEIAFPLPTQTGDYNLSLEKGTFTIDGYHDSPARSFDLKSIASAITGIQTDADGRITVITIDGRVLMQNAAPEAVKDLKGLYIINGRKELKK